VAGDMFRLTEEEFFLRRLLALDALEVGPFQFCGRGVNLKCHALVFTTFES
jgi:hypothetical protein